MSVYRYKHALANLNLPSKFPFSRRKNTEKSFTKWHQFSPAWWSRRRMRWLSRCTGPSTPSATIWGARPGTLARGWKIRSGTRTPCRWRRTSCVSQPPCSEIKDRINLSKKCSKRRQICIFVVICWLIFFLQYCGIFWGTSFAPQNSLQIVNLRPSAAFAVRAIFLLHHFVICFFWYSVPFGHEMHWNNTS